MNEMSNHASLLRAPVSDAAIREIGGLAVVGLGYWGPNWVRNLQQAGYAKRVIACDLDLRRREHIAHTFPGIEVHSNLDRVLEDPEIEGIVVATPVSTHFRIARAAIAAGKSVLVEKPLATSLHQANALRRLAADCGVVLMVGHTFEYSAPVQKIAELIAQGELGEVLYITSTRANLGLFQHDVNVVWDLATHDISIILMLTGAMPEAVSCQARSYYRKGIEDVALLTLHFGRILAFIHVSWLDPNKIRRTTIVGSRKMLVYDDTAVQEKIRIYDKGVTVQRYYDSYDEFQFAYRYGDIQIPRIDETEPLKVECQHFVECIAQRSTPRTDASSGVRVVSVLEAADRSIRNGGRPVSLPFEEDANDAAA